THFVLGQHWKNHFTKKVAETGTAAEVRHLRQWIDEPKAMGLPKEAENLVILTYALQTNYSFVYHNAPFNEASLANLPDVCVLSAEKLPPPDQWERAIERAGSIFGVAVSPLLNSSNVSSLVTGVRKKVSDGRTACQSYCQKLRDRLERLSLPLADSDRLKTATATMQVLEKLHLSADGAVVAALASAEVATSESAMGECVNNAGTLSATIDGTNWEIFEAIASLGDDRKKAAGDIRSAVELALRCDEHVTPLAGTLKDAQSKALRLLTAELPKERITKLGRTLINRGSEEFQCIADAKAKLDQLTNLTGDRRHIQVTIAWQVEEDTTK
ncbi:MAG TPA: hypothetical protein VKA15_23800, partial [Isosphaeraceae bacterium]|nr:hypothetical protein [Isosphaeraceae bacterium]